MTRIDDEVLAQNLARAALALQRRIPVWQQIGQMGGMAAADAPAPAVDPRRFNQCLNDIDRLTDNSAEGHAWRKYLLIDSFASGPPGAATARIALPRDLSQQVLKRFNQTVGH